MDGFRFAYDAPTARGGQGASASLGDEIDGERAMIVTGRTVGATEAVMDPVREGLGDRLVAEFPETTPDKRLGTAIRGRSLATEHDVDVIVGLGGGSSIDVAKMIAAFAVVDDRREIAEEIAADGSVTIPPGSLPPIVTIPTTLAGADLSCAAGVRVAPETCPVDRPGAGAVRDERLMPSLAIYDPDLLATTPTDLLAGSACNGFNKGIETLYAANGSPVTDATAAEGLDRMARGLRSLREHPADETVLADICAGLLLVQYGVSTRTGSTLSLLHALGHGITRTMDVQQGVAHAIVTPHALAYLFDRVDGNRARIARALRVSDADDPPAAIVDTVEALRDALGLPARFRDVEGADPDAFPEAASIAADDPLLENAPAGIDPTAADLEAVLDAAH